MKKLLVLLFSSMLLFSACSKKEEAKPVDDKNKYAFDSTDIKTQPVDNPNESFLLSYNFEKGKKYNYRLTSISNDNQVIKAETTLTQSVKQNLIYLIEVTPTEKDGDGTMEMNVIINSIKLDAQANGQNFHYEAGVTKDSTELTKYADYEALYKNSFTLRVSKKGEIVDIFRADKISNRYLQLKGYSDSLNSEQKAYVRKNIIDGAIRPLVIQIFRIIPDHNIAKDSTWSYSQPQSQFMTFTMQNTNLFKVLNLEKYNDDKVAVIDAGLDTKISGNTKAVDRGITYNFNKPLTTATGKIYFDIPKGCIIKSKTQTKINIFYTMEGMTPKGKQKGERKELIENTNIVEAI